MKTHAVEAVETWSHAVMAQELLIEMMEVCDNQVPYDYRGFDHQLRAFEFNQIDEPPEGYREALDFLIQSYYPRHISIVYLVGNGL